MSIWLFKVRQGIHYLYILYKLKTYVAIKCIKLDTLAPLGSYNVQYLYVTTSIAYLLYICLLGPMLYLSGTYLTVGCGGGGGGGGKSHLT